MVRVASQPGQRELDFSAAEPSKAPVASVAQVAALAGVLARDLPDQPGRPPRNGWWTADEIAADLGEHWNERKVRAVARAAVPGIVSYPGAPGYKLWARCSVEEIDAAILAFESQARDMQARAALYRDAYHRRFRG